MPISPHRVSLNHYFHFFPALSFLVVYKHVPVCPRTYQNRGEGERDGDGGRRDKWGTEKKIKKGEN